MGQLPLNHAYVFLRKHGLRDEVQEIARSSDFYRGASQYQIKRAKILALIESRGLLNDFLTEHWTTGFEDSGRVHLDRLRRLYAGLIDPNAIPKPAQSPAVGADRPSRRRRAEETRDLGRPWWQQEVSIAWALILFFPVGLWLMWRYAPWRRQFKWIWTIATPIAILFVALSIVAASIPSEDSGNRLVSDVRATPKPTKTKEHTSKLPSGFIPATPAVADCPLDESQAYTTKLGHIIRRAEYALGAAEYAQTWSDYGPIREDVVGIRADLRDLDPPPCLADIQDTALEALDATIAALAAAEEGDAAAVTRYSEKAIALLKSGNEQLDQLQRDLTGGTAKPTQQEYPSADIEWAILREIFLSECQLGAGGELCSCEFDELEKRYDLEEVKRLNQQVTDTGEIPPEFAEIALECAGIVWGQ